MQYAAENVLILSSTCIHGHILMIGWLCMPRFPHNLLHLSSIVLFLLHCCSHGGLQVSYESNVAKTGSWNGSSVLTISEREEWHYNVIWKCTYSHLFLFLLIDMLSNYHWHTLLCTRTQYERHLYKINALNTLMCMHTYTVCYCCLCSHIVHIPIPVQSQYTHTCSHDTTIPVAMICWESWYTPSLNLIYPLLLQRNVAFLFSVCLESILES